jgi:cytochrome c oxidase subunit II
MKFPLFPDQASTTAVAVDHLYFFLTALSVFFLALIFVPMLFFLFKYRRGNRADRTPPRFSTTKIEITWTVIPFLLAMGTFAWGARVYFDMEVPPADTLEINIVGKQWMWKVQHQEGNREINELHLPIGRTVKVTLASEDVIHSFFVPAFRIKQDVVPGRFTTEWFKPVRVGEYHFFCSQYCGTDHSRMIGLCPGTGAVSILA